MSERPDENSTFSRLMNTRVAQVDRLPDGRVGAVVIFEKGFTIEDAETALRAVDGIESANAEMFNPEFGSPVLYFP